MLLSLSARSILLFNENHDSQGKFASGGGSGAGSSSLVSKIKGVAKKAVWLPHHIEHAAKAGMAAVYNTAKDAIKGGGAGYSKPDFKLNPAGLAGKTIGGLKMAGIGVLKVAYSPWIAGAKAVEAVARAKGLSAEDAAKVRALTTAYDCVNCKAVVYGLHAIGMPHAAGLSTLIPTASVAYLAGSLAKNPKLVGGLAKQAVMKAVGAVHEGVSRSHMPAAAYFSRTGGSVDAKAKAAVGVLADAVKAHSGDDWYFALLTNAMDHSGNAAGAVALADKALKNTSPPR